MRTEEGQYAGYDGTTMLLRSWIPDETPKAVVLGIHGLGSHSGLISVVGEHFSSEGFLFYAPDLRGFGTYPGTKGHIESFDEYYDDIATLISHLKLKHPTEKLFLYGHSFGGMVVLLYASQYPEDLDGLITPFPSVSERLEFGSATRMIASFLSKANVKKLFDNGLRLDLISRNPEVVKRNQEDPLRFDKATSRFAIEGLNAREKSFTIGPQITLPILIQQGGDDQILIPEKNKEFFDTIASKDKTWKLYEGLYHEPFEDPGGEEILPFMTSWLSERLSE
ncbi:MAG: alpha/beta hydrolase [Candidatus Thorarchaeota archaeon]|jgi:alpha-beta hydrolase superfamily lysophospholipase